LTTFYINNIFINIKSLIRIILFLSLIISFTTYGSNGSLKKSLDAQRPQLIDDKKWNSLKKSINNVRLSPSPNGIGGEDSRFGQSVSIDGDRAVVGSANTLGGVVYVLEFDGTKWENTDILKPINASTGSLFGLSVKLLGDRIAVADSNDDSSNANSGAVYVFDYVNNDWLPTKLFASDGDEFDRFGNSLSLSDNRLLVAAYNDDDNGQDSGSIYIFNLISGQWIQTKITASDGNSGDHFGSSVSLYGDRALVGAYGDDYNGLFTGSAYIYDLIDGEWLETKLTANDGDSGDDFGLFVSLYQNRALIAATSDDNDNGIDSGSVYIYDLVNSIWVESKLIANNGQSYKFFGGSVTLGYNKAVMSSFINENGSNSGGVYVYDLLNGSWVESKLISSDNALGDNFGNSISLSNERVLIGASYNDDNGKDSGSVYIFDKVNDYWDETKYIPEYGSAYDFFGISVSLSNNRALIGAYGDDDNGSKSGSAYIFDYIEGNWISTKLMASDGARNDYFGASVSLYGDRALIGAWQDDDNGEDSGSAYIFELANGSWQESKKLLASDGAAFDEFGFSVSIINDLILIGAKGDNDPILGLNTGSAYIYELVSNEWLETKLVSNDLDRADVFGNSVSLSGNRALIGAYQDDDNGASSGSAYIFEKSNNQWIQTSKLIASDSTSGDYFGKQVSLYEDNALIGAYRKDTIENGNSSGSAYLFELVEGEWLETNKFLASDGNVESFFGISLSLGKNKLLIGANEYSNGHFSGAVYLYEKNNSGVWKETKYISDSKATNNYFGASISLLGKKFLIGTFLDDDRGNESGSASLYNLKNIFENGFEKELNE
jgi:hypothetical protein